MSESKFSKILLDRFQAGDGLAAAEIWDRYASRLKSLTERRILPRLSAKFDADDVLQTTLFEFFEKAKRDKVLWRKQGDLWRLLAAIAIHHVGRQAEKFGAAKRSVERETKVSDLNLIAGNDLAVAESIDGMLAPLLNEDSILATVVEGRLAGKTMKVLANETGRSERTLRRVLQKAKDVLLAQAEVGDELESTFLDQELLTARYEDFDLLKMIAAGGFGKVYLALDRARDCVVAVKAFRRDWIGNTVAEKMFLDEALLVSKLDHPNIVRFHKAGPLPNGSWFMVLDFVPGQSLDRVDWNHVGPRMVVDWLQQTVSALLYLHGKGVVHGDLKPANILVEGETARLIDFGFSGNESKRWLGGTSAFAAPERERSVAADVFAFGKVVEFVLSNASIPRPVRRQLLSFAQAATCKDPDKRIELSAIAQQIEMLQGRSTV